MKKLASLLLASMLALFTAGPAHAQFGPSTNGPMYNPNWYTGYVPSASQWGLLWSNKMDYFAGGLPIQYGGTGATNAAQALSNLGGMTNALPSGDIFVGNASGKATAQVLSGDCTLTNAGVLTCTKTNGVDFGALATTSTSGSNILFGNGSGGISNVTVGAGLSFIGGTLSAAGVGSTEPPNTLFAGPTSGPSAAPAFRALVAADIPDLSASYCALTGCTMSGPLSTPSLPIPPSSEPATPASGWVLYVDSADSNKLKAKASTGATVTLGVP
jgi:hypothetical protein